MKDLIINKIKECQHHTVTSDEKTVLSCFCHMINDEQTNEETHLGAFDAFNKYYNLSNYGYAKDVYNELKTISPTNNISIVRLLISRYYLMSNYICQSFYLEILKEFYIEYLDERNLEYIQLWLNYNFNSKEFFLSYSGRGTDPHISLFGAPFFEGFTLPSKCLNKIAGIIFYTLKSRCMPDGFVDWENINNKINHDIINGCCSSYAFLQLVEPSIFLTVNDDLYRGFDEFKIFKNNHKILTKLIGKNIEGRLKYIVLDDLFTPPNLDEPERQEWWTSIKSNKHLVLCQIDPDNNEYDTIDLKEFIIQIYVIAHAMSKVKVEIKESFEKLHENVPIKTII